MEEKKKAKIKTFMLMLGSILLPVFWGLFLSFLNFFWHKTYSFLPDYVYFRVEEFFAFNIHNNTMFMKLPMAVMFIGFFVWALIRNGRNGNFADFLLIIVVLIFFLYMMMPCLCRPAEYARRANCISVMKSMQQTLMYIESLPEELEVQPRNGHKVHYFGKSKNINDKKFILFEDADRSHAGNLKHRLYSDGTLEVFYPWKKR